MRGHVWRLKCRACEHEWIRRYRPLRPPTCRCGSALVEYDAERWA